MLAGKDLNKEIKINESKQQIYKACYNLWNTEYAKQIDNPESYEFYLDYNRPLKLYNVYAIFQRMTDRYTVQLITDRYTGFITTHNDLTKESLIDGLYLLNICDFNCHLPDIYKEQAWIYISKMDNEFFISNTGPRTDNYTNDINSTYGSTYKRVLYPSDLIIKNLIKYEHDIVLAHIDLPDYYKKYQKLSTLSLSESERYNYIGININPDKFILL